MQFQSSVIDLIKRRTSTRSFDKRKIGEGTLQKLCDYIDQINAEAKIKARFVYADRGTSSKDSAEKLGTYGMIAGAHSFLIGILDKNELNAFEFGYLFEKIVLFAADLGLQTCWLGGTFNRGDFAQKAKLQENEFIPIVSPVGMKKDRPRLIDVAVRAVVGANNRKPWSELFFEENGSLAMKEENAGEFRIPLEMVRLAPSASNKQPWRILVDKTGYHFYLCRTKGYGSPSFDVQKNDIGIAKCHFELTAKELGLYGSWQDRQPPNAPDGWEYITTWSLA